jgi:hypothetical protein
VLGEPYTVKTHGLGMARLRKLLMNRNPVVLGRGGMGERQPAKSHAVLPSAAPNHWDPR